MLIALDYDGTFTRDPDFWNGFIGNCATFGHEVVCATMRHESEPITMICPVIYTARQPKMAFLAEKGINPDIWIDDMPQLLFVGA